MLAAGWLAVKARTGMRMEPMWAPWVGAWEEPGGRFDGGPSLSSLVISRNGSAHLQNGPFNVESRVTIRAGAPHLGFKVRVGHRCICLFERDPRGQALLEIGHLVELPLELHGLYSRKAVRVEEGRLP